MQLVQKSRSAVACLFVVWCGIAAALNACATRLNSRSPTEYLDSKTAATVTFSARPLVFARERPELAAHSRDYVTLAAASVNRGGVVDYFLLAYFWSTLDARDGDHGGEPQSGDGLTIAADDRLLRLRTDGRSIQEVGLGTAVHAPPHHRWKLTLHRTDIATLRFLAESRQLAIVTPGAGGSITYELWDDERQSLRGLVDRLEGRD